MSCPGGMPPETMPLFPFMNALLKTFLEHQHWRARHNPMLSCMWASGKFLLTLHLRMEPPVPHSQEPGAWALEGGRRGGHLSLMPQGSENMDLLQLILPLQTSPQTYTSLSVHVVTERISGTPPGIRTLLSFEELLCLLASFTLLLF